MRLACVIPATDRPATLERCLAAIAACEQGPDQVEVVDDPSLGDAAAARNAGIAATEGELIAFVDADVELHPDAFVRIRAALNGPEAPAAVFGTYDDKPAEPDPVSTFRNLLHHTVHVEGAGPAETFWTGIGAVRREVLEEVGPFDSSRVCVEDIDLGMRIAAAGHKIVLDPSIQGTHLKRWTLGSMVRTDFSGRGIPWARMVLERRTGAGALNLGPRGRAGALASVVTAILIARRRPTAAAAAAGALALVNLPLLGAIARVRGAGHAAVAIPLLAIHHLTGIAAALSAALLHVRSGRP